MTSLWHQLWSASWLATTGIPLVGTVVAILAGFELVRRQLRHDRLLLTAQNRALAARRLGLVLLRPGIDNTRFKFKTLRALGEARAVLGGLPIPPRDQVEPRYKWDLLETVEVAIHAFDRVHRHARNRVAEFLRAAGQQPPLASSELAVQPYRTYFRAVAETLMRWDGMGPLPLPPAWPDHLPIARLGLLLPSKEAVAQYVERVIADEFADETDEM